MPDEFALEKCNIKYGRVVVDELQQIDLKRKRIIKLCLGSPHFQLGQILGQNVVQLEKKAIQRQFQAELN